jgi:hypothetical protein
MCLDYNKIEMDEILREISEAIKKKQKTKYEVDPLLEGQPDLSRSMSILHGIKVSHGTWIEKSMADFIRAIPDWGSKIKVKLNIGGDVMEIDNIAYNQKSNKVIIWECKRRWETVDPVKRGLVHERFDKLVANKTTLDAELQKEFGIKPNSIDFFVFNCWGEDKSWPKGRTGYEIFCREELGKIFGSCLWDCLRFHRDYIAHAAVEYIGLDLGIKKQGNPFFERESVIL